MRLEKEKNCYMGSSNEEFLVKLDEMIAKKIPSLAEEGYLVAKERSIEEVGESLKAVYETLLKS